MSETAYCYETGYEKVRESGKLLIYDRYGNWFVTLTGKKEIRLFKQLMQSNDNPQPYSIALQVKGA